MLWGMFGVDGNQMLKSIGVNVHVMVVRTKSMKRYICIVIGRMGLRDKECANVLFAKR